MNLTLFFRASRIQLSALSAVPISSSWSITAEGAPPCAGPLSAPMAPTRQDARSESVEAMTRAVKVDAFMPWSANRTRYVLSACTSSGAASFPFSM